MFFTKKHKKKITTYFKNCEHYDRNLQSDLDYLSRKFRCESVNNLKYKDKTTKRFTHINTRINNDNKKFDAIADRLNQLDDSIQSIHKIINKIEAKIMLNETREKKYGCGDVADKTLSDMAESIKPESRLSASAIKEVYGTKIDKVPEGLNHDTLPFGLDRDDDYDDDEELPHDIDSESECDCEKDDDDE